MALEGLIEEFHLSELIQVLSNAGKTCLVTLKTPYGHGMIYLREGKVTHVTDGISEGEDVFYSFLWWSSGQFEVIPDEYPEKISIRMGTHALIMEGNRILDEWTALREEMPDLDYDSIISLSPKTPINTFSKLPPNTLTVIQKLIKPMMFRELVRTTSLQELELGRLLSDLQKKDLLVIEHKKYTNLSLVFKKIADLLFEEFSYNATLMQLKSFEKHLSETAQFKQWPFHFRNYTVILNKTQIEPVHLAKIYTSFLETEMNYILKLSTPEILRETLKKVSNKLTPEEKIEAKKLSIFLE